MLHSFSNFCSILPKRVNVFAPFAVNLHRHVKVQMIKVNENVTRINYGIPKTAIANLPEQWFLPGQWLPSRFRHKTDRDIAYLRKILSNIRSLKICDAELYLFKWSFTSKCKWKLVKGQQIFVPLRTLLHDSSRVLGRSSDNYTFTIVRVCRWLQRQHWSSEEVV